MEKWGRGFILWMTLCLAFAGSAQSSKQFFSIQEQPEQVCASDIIHQRMMTDDVEYRTRVAAVDRALQEATRHGDTQRSNTIYTIPVVVHVMHEGEEIGTGSNISETQIQSAIEALNEDFRKVAGSNGDGAGVDVRMQFCLASRDPQGNPSNGIVRVDASTVPLYAEEGISVGQGNGANEVSVKSLSRWDRDDYYNIWLVNEIEDNDGGAGIQGFAYFPNSSVSKDGTVVLYNAFGTEGNLKSYTNLNRTLTHEIGHAFSLYHTFQGNNCSETNCNTQGDQVCDTPPTVNGTSCNNPACGGTQQVENYMGYTHQSCMDMFTQGQKDRMRSALTNFRPGLINSLGCTPPNAFDVGVVAVNRPTGYSCSSSFSPQVKIKNFGSETITSLDIRYRIDNGTLLNHSYSGSLATGAEEVVTLPNLFTTNGAHSFHVYTEAPNGGTDGHQSNDAMNIDFEVVEGSTVTVAIEVDNRGNETTWEVRNQSGDLIANGGPYPANAYGTVFESSFCLAADCFDFTIFDSYGDGICCGAGFGGYEIRDATGNVLLVNGADFEDSETRPFCVEATGSVNLPTADLSADRTLACVGTAVQFTDQSTGAPTSWTWTFQGGSPANSSMQNPIVTFNSPGQKNVSLSVSNADGSDSVTRNGYITVTEAGTLSLTMTDASCHNANDGAADLNITGGTAPFSYQWNNNSQSQDLNDLSSGTYAVSVSDGAGCTSTTAGFVDAPSAIVIQVSDLQAASCTPTGSVTVSASGGTPGYTYLWNDANTQTTASATELAAGDYTVFVTDAHGCQSSLVVEVEGSSDMVLTGSKEHVSCHGGQDGEATVQVTGGQAPYTYLWNDAQQQSAQTAIDLPAGTHQVTVTDNTGCQANKIFYLQEPTELEIEVLSQFEISCHGGGDGAMSAAFVGGTEPYAHHWNGAGFGQNLSPQGLSAGEYVLTLIDGNACTVSHNFLFVDPSPVQVQLVSMTPDSCDLNVGKLEIEVSGGAGLKSVEWNDTEQQTGTLLNQVRFGEYEAQILDMNDCPTQYIGEVEEQECTATSVPEYQYADLRLFPNPVDQGYFSLQWTQSDSQPLSYVIIDTRGRIMQADDIRAQSQQARIAIGHHIPSGLYVLHLRTRKGSLVKKLSIR